MASRLWVMRENPARVVVAAFVALIAVGTALLGLPVAHDAAAYRFDDALFLATSAATVTGMTTVGIDQLTLFGELVVLVLVQAGGFLVMSVGTVLGITVARRVGLRRHMLARPESGSIRISEVRGIMVSVALVTVAVEAATAIVLGLRWWIHYDEPAGTAAYHGIFHAVMSLNNASVVLYPDGLTRFVGDPVIVLAISAAVVLGGLGFPVILELVRRVAPRTWSLHTKIVLATSGALFVVGPAVMIAFEWTNPDTLGPLDVDAKLLGAWFHGGPAPRSAGFNTVDTAALNEPTLLVTTALMFIGSGPASTGGGIRVTTFALLGAVLWSVVRGDADMHMFRRHVPMAVVNQAITVVLLSIAAVVAATLVMLASTDFTLLQTLFEATSAFGTTGLSTGITGELPGVARVAMVALMLAGRVGPVTVVTALTLRERPRLYRYPEERPIIG